jgi:hypothetical protein
MVVMHCKLLGGVFVVRAEVVRGTSCLDLIARRETGEANMLLVSLSDILRFTCVST